MARCLTPFTKKGDTVPLPCGRCPSCTSNRASGWSFRLMKEAERSSSALFITLTYSPEYLPLTKNGFADLCKVDIQKFMKRLRKIMPHNTTLKYYVAGEYGTKSFRPHYHMILYNLPLEQIQDIEKVWKLGSVHIGQVEPASVGYTLKYISKPSRIPLHKNDDRLKEFSLMSKRLGDNYLTPNTITWHLSDFKNRLYLPLEDGKKAVMPRYYRERIYSKSELRYIGLYARRLEYQRNVDKNYKEIQLELAKEDNIRIEKIRKAFRKFEKDQSIL